MRWLPRLARCWAERPGLTNGDLVHGRGLTNGRGPANGGGGTNGRGLTNGG